jgi:hypothetical protein
VNTQADTFGVKLDAPQKIRDHKIALDKKDLKSLLPLIQLLHTTLNPEEIVARIHQGSMLDDFSTLRQVDRVILLQYAERWGADARDIERMSNTFTPDDLRDRSLIAMIVSGVRQRLATRALLTGGPMDEVALLSIGADCLGWTIPNRWGLRRAEDIPSSFNPMSLAVHRPKFIVKMIETGFEDYLDNTMLITTMSRGGSEIVARADGGALWNHCAGAFWSHRGYRKFKRIMSRRLDRFLMEAFRESSKFRVFIFNLTNVPTEQATRDYIAAAAAALASRVKGPHGVVAIDSNRRRVRPAGRAEIAPRVALIEAPPPGPHYIWSEAKDYNSAEGIDYELNIVRTIHTCIAEWVQPRG